jgi:hypothetical protein
MLFVHILFFLFGHVPWWLPFTSRIFNSPCVVSWLFHVSCTGSFTCHIFIWSRGMSRFYHALNNHFIRKIIRDRQCCTGWLHNYLTNDYIIIQPGNQIKYNNLQFTHQQQAPNRVSPHQTNTQVHTSNHKCSLHQAHRVKDWELPEEELKRKISSRSLLYSSYCCLLNSSNSLLVFSVFFQFIHLFDEGSGTFLFGKKLLPKHLVRQCLCSGGACQDTSILQKKGVAAALGVDLALGEAEDLWNNISTGH